MRQILLYIIRAHGHISQVFLKSTKIALCQWARQYFTYVYADAHDKTRTMTI